MAELHGLKDLIFVAVAARQIIGQQFDDVPRTEILSKAAPGRKIFF